MKPITFAQANTTYAKDQPPYLPLPAYKTEDGIVISCWQLSLLERLKLLIAGRIYVKMLTFNKPLQPIKLELQPFVSNV